MKSDLEFVFVSKMEQVLEAALEEMPKPKPDERAGDSEQLSGPRTPTAADPVVIAERAYSAPMKPDPATGSLGLRHRRAAASSSSCTTNAEYLAQSVGRAARGRARARARLRRRSACRELDRALLTTDPEALLGDPSHRRLRRGHGRGRSGARLRRARPRLRSAASSPRTRCSWRCTGRRSWTARSRNGVDLAFEGSVGGGIPVIRVLRDALASDWVTSRSKGSSTARATTS